MSEEGDETFFKAPVSYQLADDGTRIAVESAYIIHEDGSIGFTLGNYDSSRELVIDPILDYTTFVGGTGYDSVAGVAVDDSGNVYITGQTNSTDFPTTAGALSENHAADGGTYDMYVAKLSADGSSLLFSTFIGGDGSDTASSIAVDSVGNIYVAGGTSSTDMTTVNAYQGALNGTSSDGMLLKLNSTGDTLLYSSYFGGAGIETTSDLVVDDSGVVHIVGRTSSALLPVKNAYDSTLDGSQDAYIASFDTTLSGPASLIYSTYFGGGGSDDIRSLDVDADGNIIVAGLTDSAFALPIVNGYQTSGGGGNDAYVAKFSSDGSTLLYSTYLGGSLTDYANAVAVDSSGYIYVGGRTEGSFVTTGGAFDEIHGGGGISDGFITKLDSTQSGAASLVYSTYLGGSSYDYVNGLDVDDNGTIYIAGYTGSSASTFPETTDGNDRILTGLRDGFFATLSADGSTLEYGTYIGGSGQDSASDVVWNQATGSAYVGGSVPVADGPTSPTPTSIGAGGAGDGFVAKFSFNQAPVITIDPSPILYLNGSMAIDPNLTVTDVDDTMLESAQVWFGDGYLRGQDRLEFTDQLGIAGSFNIQSGILTLTGNASVANYQTALRSVQYRDANPTPAEGLLYVNFSVSDGTAASLVDTRVLEIVDNLPPRAGDDFATVNEGNAVVIDLAANDTDVDALDLGSIVITSAPTNGGLVINGDGTVT